MTKFTWPRRLADPWFVLPLFALGGVIFALAIAVALKPDNTLPDTSATLPGVVATAEDALSYEALAGYRDIARNLDIYKVSAVLLRYHADHGAYPVTATGVHTLCAEAEDAGCALRAYLDTVPMDPRGGQGRYGYWYASDGTHLTLYVSMELNENATPGECPSEPAVGLESAKNLHCINLGP